MQGNKARKLLAGKGSRCLKALAFLASAGVLAGALWGISQVNRHCTVHGASCSPLPSLHIERKQHMRAPNDAPNHLCLQACPCLPRCRCPCRWMQPSLTPA